MSKSYSGNLFVVSDDVKSVNTLFRDNGVHIQWQDTNNFWTQNKHIMSDAKKLLKQHKIKFTVEVEMV